MQTRASPLLSSEHRPPAISHHVGVRHAKVTLNSSQIVGLHLMNTYSDRVNASDLPRAVPDPVLRRTAWPQMQPVLRRYLHDHR